MIGAEGAAAALAQLLTDAVVAEVAITTAENGPLADGTGRPEDPEDPDGVDADAIAALVTPRLIVPAPPADIAEVGIDDWPFVAVSMRNAPAIRPAPAPAGNPGDLRLYGVEYEARVFTWVRGDGYAQVKAIRDRLILVIRQVLLRSQRWDVGIRLVEQTLVEDYAPVGVDSTLGATIAAGYLQGRFRALESLPGIPSYGQVESVTVSVGRADTP